MPGARRSGLDLGELVLEVTSGLLGLRHGAAATVALSGGPDSAGLALLVRHARPDLRLTAAHIRHGLRDDAADEDAARGIAQVLGLPFTSYSVTVVPAGEGVEAAARRARLAALSQAAVDAGAAAVLLGHTADDQAETVLLALGRGTGLRGLAAMPRWRHEGEIVLMRPLLRLRRVDVRAAAVAAGLRPIEDPTNADPGQRRRRVRVEVLPALARLSGDRGDPVGILTRLADLAREDVDFLDELAAAESRRLVRTWGPVRVIRAEHLAALPPALARRVVRLALAAVRGGLDGLDAATTERVLGLAPGGAVTVSGGTVVTANGGWLAAAPPDLADLPSRSLPVPGMVELPEVGLRIVADAVPPDGAAPDRAHLPPRSLAPRGRAAAAAVSVDAEGPLVVRARRQGDRLPGSTSRSLGDSLTNLGVPRSLRGLVPVVADGRDDTPLWVPGVAVGPVGGSPVHLRLEPSSAAGP